MITPLFTALCTPIRLDKIFHAYRSQQPLTEANFAKYARDGDNFIHFPVGLLRGRYFLNTDTEANGSHQLIYITSDAKTTVLQMVNFDGQKFIDVAEGVYLSHLYNSHFSKDENIRRRNPVKQFPCPGGNHVFFDQWSKIPQESTTGYEEIHFGVIYFVSDTRAFSNFPVGPKIEDRTVYNVQHILPVVEAEETTNADGKKQVVQTSQRG